MGPLISHFQECGLPYDREKCARLLGVTVADDEALQSLRLGLTFADIGFLDKGREGILEALKLDPGVFERAPTPDECWLLCAKAFAESDPERALAAYAARAARWRAGRSIRLWRAVSLLSYIQCWK